ncbi:hypothetical protein CXF59_01060 [Flavobacterium sp. ALD4]|uniref:hypothetical protein n=1 Tax=Flavobacterium sp. ALD4 TaxID=2058314 RepID=UPI000C342DCF|nr:hypothetical protein [Flavobacterium sp. ALD4]PKH68896.1 hypothetical protein CXF59_01060 [Flavobacterium sp. ALD4]
MSTANTQSFDFNGLEQGKDKNLTLQFIVNQVEKGSGKSVFELKKYYSEDALFFIALRYVTTTKKALCTALNIPIEGGCRYKRSFEKNGTLVQSIDEVVCPFTKHFAHEISTNPQEFERLLKTKSRQLNLFE